jgi:hypothetical protein
MITTKAVMDSLPEDAGAGPLAVLSRFRLDFHACLTARADELSELADAVLCADGPVRTLAGLSLAPEHRRGHGALYDAAAPRGAVLYRPRSGQGWEELSLDLMADLEPKGEGDNSMPGNRQLMPRRMGWRAGGSA